MLALSGQFYKGKGRKGRRGLLGEVTLSKGRLNLCIRFLSILIAIFLSYYRQLSAEKNINNYTVFIGPDELKA